MTLTDEQIESIKRDAHKPQTHGWSLVVSTAECLRIVAGGEKTASKALAGISADIIMTLLSALEAANKRSAELEEPGVGWLFHNPDTGVEFSRQHPIKSGEVDDAEHVRPATAENILPLLLEAWADLRERDALKARADEAEPVRAELTTLKARVAELEAALAKYKHDMCEGFCSEVPRGYVDDTILGDCGGCLARSVLAALKGGSHEQG